MVLGSISGGRIFAETAVTVARMELPMESEGRAGQRETERGGECVAEKITQADTKKNELASAETCQPKVRPSPPNASPVKLQLCTQFH